MSLDAVSSHAPNLSTGEFPAMEQCTWVNERGEPRSTHLAVYGEMILVGSIARDLAEHGHATPVTDISQVVAEYGRAAIEHANLYGHAGV